MATFDERERRWRLILGGGAADGIGLGLEGDDRGIDAALTALYEQEEGGKRPRGGDLSGSSPRVARWLDDIRKYFPGTVVQVMQADALERLGMQRMLLEPELLASLTPDVHLVGTLLALRQAMPAKTRETARQVIQHVVDELTRKLAAPTRQAILGAVHRAVRNPRPRLAEIDWHRTIRANLQHYQPSLKTIVPQRIVGFGRKRSSVRDIVLCIDQSGSMAASVVYAGIFAAVMASLPAVSTRVIAFDTAVVDLSEHLQDPVDLLFGIQLGGGTDIERALGYAQSLVTRPTDTIMVLISDLIEGGSREALYKRAASLVAMGVQVIALLALSDEGAPSYDRGVAAVFASLGIVAFACTPDRFPELMAAAIARRDLSGFTVPFDEAPKHP